MTYLPALGVTSPDLTPGGAIDIIQTWNITKDGLIASLGEHKFKDGSLATYQGRRVPLITAAMARTIHDWMIKIGQKAKSRAASAGRNISSIQAAIDRYDAFYAPFRGLSSFTSILSERLALPQAGAFIVATDNYALELSSSQWAAFNIETKMEMIRSALHETPGGDALLAVAGALRDVVGMGGFFLGNLGTILKLALIGGAGFVGWQVYKKTKDVGEAP